MSALVLLVAALVPSQADPWDLRERIEVAAEDGLSEDELTELSGQVLAAAEGADSRGSFLGCVALAAELCHRAPGPAVRGLRARALGLLARRDSDTMRWSSLVVRELLPDLAPLPRETWAGELADYERTLDELTAADVSERARAELGFAAVFARVAIERRWDVSTDGERAAALERLGSLRSRYGHLPVPGTAGEPRPTLAERADAFEYELTKLRFGAVAPPTRGEDLQGERLDVADLRGRVVVIDFWTSFCQPCLALVPSTRALLAELEGEPVTWIGVCGDTDRAAGRATAARVGMTWRNLWDGPRGTEGPAATAWNVEAVGWPTVVVLDGRGRIRAKLYGREQVERELGSAVRALLRAGPEEGR